MFLTGVLSWIIYGYKISSTPILIANIVTFILDENDNIKYKFFSKDILNYSKNMKSPIDFLYEYI